MRRFAVISGYYAPNPPKWRPQFLKLWWQQNILPIKPVETYIVSSRRQPHASACWIPVSGDLGHCDAMLTGKRPELFLPGCPCSWMAGAWLAYANECDMLYIEQDVLAFGPWLDQLYQDLGSKQAIFGSGRLHKGSSTSLFLVRHKYIPRWCQDYLNEGPENVYERLPEQKWRRMSERRPEDYARLSFGYDTDRPFNIEDPCFYLQKITGLEMDQLVAKGLVAAADRPVGDFFSNHP